MRTMVLSVPDDLVGHVAWLLDGEETKDRVSVLMGNVSGASDENWENESDEDSDVEERDYTAIFTLTMPKGASDEDWEHEIKFMQDQFDNQWAQTKGSGQAWTVTIHADDDLGEVEQEFGPTILHGDV